MNNNSGREPAIRMTLTVPQMADELNISLTKAYELAASDGFPSFKIDRKVLISRVGLYKWIDRQIKS